MHPYTTDSATDERRHTDADDNPDTMAREDHQSDEARREEGGYGEHDAGLDGEHTLHDTHDTIDGTSTDETRTEHDPSTGYHDDATTGYDQTRADHDTAATGYDETRTDQDTAATGYDETRTDHDTAATGYDETRTDHDGTTGYHDAGVDDDSMTGYHESRHAEQGDTATGFDQTRAGHDAAATGYETRADQDDHDAAPGYDGTGSLDHDGLSSEPAYVGADTADTAHTADTTAAYAANAGVTERPPQTVEDDWTLFGDDDTTSLRSRWNELQGSFVDDPRQALEQAEQFVGEVVQSLTDRFNDRRNALRTGDTADTEELRLAMRRYRTFFQQLTGG